jgi:hypothetical protein
LEQWQFFQDVRNNWCWRQLDSSSRNVGESRQCFSSRTDCIADAMRNGYLIGRPMFRPGVRRLPTDLLRI